MKITFKDVGIILADEIWTGFLSNSAFQRIADKFNEIAQREDIYIPTKDLLEAEGQLRLF